MVSILTSSRKSSPVHSGNKVDRIGNKVERISNKVDRDKLSNSRCCRFVAKTGNKVERIRQQSTLLPICCRFWQQSSWVDRVEFNFVASVYRALRRFFKSPFWTHHMATHNGNKLTCISGTVTDSIEIPTTAVLCIYLYSLPHTEIWKRYHKMLRYRRSRSEVVPVESPYATSYLSSIVMQCV